MFQVKNLFFSLLFLLAMLSCKGQWIVTHEYASYQESRKVPCRTLGYCYDCSWLHGYHFCWHGPYNNCPGTKLILVDVTPEDGYYINHPNKIVKRQRARFVKELGPCKVNPLYMLQQGQYQIRMPEE